MKEVQALKVKIAADSSVDLSPELVERYGIGVLPGYVVKNGTSYLDGVNITPDEIYAHVAAGGALCSTAAVGVADYIDYFTKVRREYDGMVYFHISSDMSACYQNACIAEREVSEVYSVDSRSLSTGIGLLVLAAAEMAETGMSAAEIKAAVDQMRDKLDVSFVVSTLAYLRKGGRCSSVAALGANLMSLKPCIEVSGGAMHVGKKYRGKIEKCLLQYVRDRLEGRTDIDLRRIFITDSGNFTEELRQTVRAEVLKYQPFKEVLFTRAGCTVSCHCGPGTLGILFLHR